VKFFLPDPLGRVHRRRAHNAVRHYGPYLAMAWGLWQISLGAFDPTPLQDPLIEAVMGPGLAGQLWFCLLSVVVALLVFFDHNEEWCPRCQTHPRRAAARAQRYAYTLHLAHTMGLRHWMLGTLLIAPARYWWPSVGVAASGALLFGFCWVMAVHRSLAMACQWCPHDLLGPNLHAVALTDHHGHLKPWRACLYWAYRMNRTRRTVTVFHHRHPGHTLSLSCDSGTCTDGITTTSSARSVQWLNQHLAREHATANSHGYLLYCTECDHARAAKRS